jgi:hypothetical protein
MRNGNRGFIMGGDVNWQAIAVVVGILQLALALDHESSRGAHSSFGCLRCLWKRM